ncbi:MAG: NADH-quinone oxidoreductase subunit H [Acidimicrobiales bacterium]
MTVLVGPVAIGFAMLVGIWAVAAIDAAVASAVAGRGLRPRRAALAPLRRALVLAGQGPVTTERPDGAAWVVAAPGLLALAGAALSAVPLTGGVAVADIPDGLVLYGAAMALVMVAVFLHGWAPNSPFPLIGAYRFAAQALSYQIALFLVLLGAALPSGSLGLGAIVESQAGLWNVVRQPLGLPLFLVTGMALSFWGPLGLADGADLAGGTAGESSGRELLVWRAARAGVLVATAAVAAACFLGGWFGPLLPGPAWMVLKTLAVLVVLVTPAHLVPRLRIERFVTLGWTVLLPLALFDVFAAGVVAL